MSGQNLLKNQPEGKVTVKRLGQGNSRSGRGKRSVLILKVFHH
jgi:hypothetical protein